MQVIGSTISPRTYANRPQAQRWAMIHCHHLELSHEEAAVVLGWPLGTLKSHLARGKAALRLALADWRPGVSHCNTE
jgi:RNA polymerase sigma-70 factor (ECF subfamily)